MRADEVKMVAEARNIFIISLELARRKEGKGINKYGTARKKYISKVLNQAKTTQNKRPL